MKKTISKILVLLFVFALAVSCLASCDLINGKHTHSFVDGECECGEKDPNYVPPHTHSYSSEETKAPTCTEKGTKTFTCECGDTYTEDIDVKAHSYVDGVCSSCGQADPSIPVVIVLSLEADKTQAVIGETVTLSALLDGTALEGVTYTVVEGPASISGNVLTVSDTAKDGDVIKVQTEYDGVKSNIVSITVIPSTHVDSITAEVGSYSDKIVKGSTVALIATVDPAGIASSFVQWKITEGDDIATIRGNSLTVSAEAETGAVVKVVAYFGNVESNELTLTVTDPAIFSLSLEANAVQAVPGATVEFTAYLNGEAIADAVYTVISGPATISGNKLTISDTAVDGDVIKVKTQHQGVDSNVVVISVIPSTHVDSITLGTQSASQNVMKGATIGLVATVNPAGVAQSFVQFKITEGADYAYINGTALCVNGDAPTGAIIKVVAYFGEVESNEIELTVAATQEEINAGRYFIMVSNEHITVDKFGASASIISVTVRNYNFEIVNDLELSYTIIDGDTSLLSLENEGNTCKLFANGHGTVTVQVAVPGTSVTADVVVDVIAPPTAITLPEVFAERPMEYQFSYRDSLPFAVGIVGDNVCQDVAYSFVHESGKTGNDVAVYNADGTITFKMLGKVTVNVQSASGSRNEAKVSYTFDINDGYNVYTFEELQYLVQKSGKYKGEEINVVVLDKPVDPDGYAYGYDLVPPVAFLPDEQQTVALILDGVSVTGVRNRWILEDDITEENPGTVSYTSNARVQAVNTSLWLNGNNHRIDASQIRIFTKDEYVAYAIVKGIDEDEYIPNISSVFSAETWYSGGQNDPNFVKTSYSVKLYNFEVKGNVGVSYDPTKYMANKNGDPSYFVGGVYYGISIGSRNLDTHYYVDVDNLTVSGTCNGLSFTHIVGNGKVSNLYAYDCYSTGVMVRSSIVTLENLKFGMCGATGMELAPEESANAGLNSDEKSKITISGTVDASTNLNDGATNYFTYYNIQGYTVPQIITGNTQMYNANQVAHIRNENGQFVFVSLVFNDLSTLAPNESIVEYPAYQEGGIVNIANLPTSGIDTEHQFIEMPIMVTLTGLGTVQAGTAYFYNHNYAGN